MKDVINIPITKDAAEILLIQLRELEMRTTTVNWVIKYLENKLGK